MYCVSYLLSRERRDFARLRPIHLRGGAALSVLLLASACGGGGGGGRVNPITPPPVAPTPTPTPVPTPAPTPTPTPTVNYDTTEYRATVGAVSANALAAYNRAATGAGITVGVIDTGIDLQSEEFGGRIHPASQDTAGNGTVDDEGGHGTAVAFTLAGRRNDVGTHGIAFDATVLALRTDRPGSCATEDPENDDSGCRHPESAIASALDVARTNGARVVNISLGGGGGVGNTLLQAINRATAAGVIIVISAGNDAEANPDAFASTPALNSSIARGLIVIAGSVGTTDEISTFSNRAGSAAAVYLSAVGERVRAPNQENVPFLWSGTSFSAPQIAGAAALLAQAFPNLTGQQIVDLLLTTARDVGAAGTDAIYGRGVLDLTRAFQPVGTTGIAGMSESVSLSSNATLSAPMGDATSHAGLGAVILDGYDRAFAIDLATTIRREGPARSLSGVLRTDRRHVSAAYPGGSIAVTIAPTRARNLIERLEMPMGDAQVSRAIAATATGRLGEDVTFGFGVSEGSGGLVAQLSGRDDPAFLVAGDATRSAGFDISSDASVAVRQQWGRLGLTVAVESGDVLTRGQGAFPQLRGRFDRYGYDRITIGFDRRFGALATNLNVTRLAEADTVLGAQFSGALGAARATSYYVDTSMRWSWDRDWSLGMSMRQGWTQARLRGGVEGAGTLRTNGYAIDIARLAVFSRSDRWGLRFAQPMRVALGGLDLRLPTNWDYASSSVDAWTTQRLNLAPTGREIDVEMRYSTPLWAGNLGTNLFLRRHPGNFAQLGNDVGAVARYSMAF
ncbi:S8 family peptidase [Sphingomonas sp. AX6]|uniref:S8 family peptidase n=1 Tax=Sphingomonas sp. AX6 TaxID=2653171 RepID=UPI0012EF5936|nr:S8 family peptidase [Sphingomonas sp. AX6]VXC62076.1 Peptidase S8 [Sphingomonas sp. AX6]